MDRRREQRIGIVLPVQIWGTDAEGKEFTQQARTTQVSKRGASLEGVHSVKEPGGTITLQYRDKKARFQVMWVGQPGSSREGQIGIRCLEPAKFSWDVVVVPLHRGPAIDGKRPKPDQRRQHVRYGCSGNVAVRVDISVSGVLSDISQGGCYISTRNPLPVRTPVAVDLTIHDLRLKAKGVVQVVDAQQGMGINFTELTSEDQKALHNLLHELSSCGARPQQIFRSETRTGLVIC